MRTLMIAALALMPTLVAAQGIVLDDGPWIAVPTGMTFEAQKSPAEEIKAMANLDGDPSVTTSEELEMIVLLTQILGAEPISR